MFIVYASMQISAGSLIIRYSNLKRAIRSSFDLM